MVKPVSRIITVGIMVWFASMITRGAIALAEWSLSSPVFLFKAGGLGLTLFLIILASDMFACTVLYLINFVGEHRGRGN